jgi:metallophosphoesterase superfamily enzyme
LAVETVTHIGMTSQGRREIRRIGDTTVETIKKILERGIDGEKVRALVAYGDLVRFFRTV